MLLVVLDTQDRLSVGSLCLDLNIKYLPALQIRVLGV